MWVSIYIDTKDPIPIIKLILQTRKGLSNQNITEEDNYFIGMFGISFCLTWNDCEPTLPFVS